MPSGPLTHRHLLVVVVVLAVATVAGLVALWPPLTDDSEPLEPLVTGELVAVEVVPGEPDEFLGLSGDTALLEVAVLDGPDAGTTLELEVTTDGFPELRVGDRVLMDRLTDVDGELRYFITDLDRLPALLWLVGLFVVVVLAVSRWHGLRSLLGLALSLAIVVRFVVPAIIAGTSPPLVAMVGAMAVMLVTLYLVHGVNEMTTSAIIGTAGALVLTIGLGSLFIDRGRITGFASDDAVFARFAVDGLDLQGLVLAGLIIAALGVLDDVTISQASTVFALHDTDRTQTWPALFGRAMQVGRDHIASVVNTLFLAYTGASIALLLLFTTGGVPTRELLNSELLAEEIVKTVVGSLGLIAAVPLTTALAATIAISRGPDAPPLRRAHQHGPAVPPVSAAATNAAAAPGSEPAAPRRPTAAEDDAARDQRAAEAWQRYLERHDRARRDADEGGGPDPR
ncbi:MAG: YibE/F family protein [Nitriliruptoraceae bacterium]